MGFIFTFRWLLNDSREVEAYLGKRGRWVSGRVVGLFWEDALEALFTKFNHGEQPEGYRSMSVGDFITLTLPDREDYPGETRTYVCCNSGWQIVPSPEMV